MTHNVDTAFDRTFSDPPNVTVSAQRTHCEACQEPLDPHVMHKCAGNEEWKPPLEQPRHPDLTNYKGVCPGCNGVGYKIVPADDPLVETRAHCGLCKGAGVIE